MADNNAKTDDKENSKQVLLEARIDEHINKKLLKLATFLGVTTLGGLFVIGSYVSDYVAREATKTAINDMKRQFEQATEQTNRLADSTVERVMDAIASVEEAKFEVKRALEASEDFKNSVNELSDLNPEQAKAIVRIVKDNIDEIEDLARSAEVLESANDRVTFLEKAISSKEDQISNKEDQIREMDKNQNNFTSIKHILSDTIEIDTPQIKSDKQLKEKNADEAKGISAVIDLPMNTIKVLPILTGFDYKYANNGEHDIQGISVSLDTEEVVQNKTRVVATAKFHDSPTGYGGAEPWTGNVSFSLVAFCKNSCGSN